MLQQCKDQDENLIKIQNSVLRLGLEINLNYWFCSGDLNHLLDEFVHHRNNWTPDAMHLKNFFIEQHSYI